MERPRQTGEAYVLDSDGVMGTVALDALQGGASQVLITFDGNRRVQTPAEMLTPRDDGSYFLPVSLRELETGIVSLERSADGNVVAVIPPIVIPLVEEQAQLRIRTVETGRVRIQKRVEQTEERVELPVVHEHVQVERVPVERELDEPLAAYYDGDTLVIPVMEEVLVVQKRLMLREEVRVTKLRESATRQESVVLRSEVVTVEREPIERGDASSDGPADQS